MSKQQPKDVTVSVDVRNVGGIDETSVTLAPGITVLAGRNATNRTSFLQAVMAGLGSDGASLKGDADEGSVELSVGGETYTRRFTRDGGRVTTSGSPYLDDAELADLFAFLLESNEARQAVARNADLRELIMEPVDTDAIESRIRALESEKRDIDEELETLDELDAERASLAQRRADLEATIAEKREALREKEADIEAANGSVDETREREDELEARLDELRDRRAALDDIRYDLETERESRNALREELAALQSEYEESDPPEPERLGELDTELDRLRTHRQSVESTINQLRNIVSFNEDLVEGDDLGLRTELADEDDAVTDRLVEDSVVCWTCGNETTESELADTLETLRDLRQQKVEERNELTAELDALKEERKSLEAERERHEDLAERIEATERRIEERETEIERLRDRREGLAAEIESLEADVDALEGEQQSSLLELHREANELEFELGRLESDLDDVREKLSEVDDRLERRAPLESQRAEVREELTDLRTRVDDLESRAIEEFNRHMGAVLDRLEYGNVERIWLERVHTEARDGGRNGERTSFDLHVVRKTDDGTTYEDTLDHLSESEREVTGLVFALAGYLVHSVHEEVPFLLFDSLEAIDAERIAALVDYVSEYADYVVVALLPEDAAALDVDHERITDI